MCVACEGMILLFCLLHDSFLSLPPAHRAGVHCTVSKKIDLGRKDIDGFPLSWGLDELVQSVVLEGVWMDPWHLAC